MIQAERQYLSGLEKKPISNFFKIRKVKKRISAMQEAGRDVLNTAITRATSTAAVVDKNHYKTYASKVKASYEMYNARCDYGAELYKGIVDTIVSLIGGAGLTVIAEKAETQMYIDEFLEKNKLNGSRLLNFITIGEIEGRNLLLLKPGKHITSISDKPDYIKARSFQWYYYPYTLESNELDYDDIKKITYTKKGDAGENREQTISTKEAVYVQLGGTPDRQNETSNKIHAVLTDIENYSRSKYDLRKNTHIFGKITPFFATEDAQQARSINNALSGQEWEIGKSYAGTANLSLLEPSGGAADQAVKDMLTALKTVAMTTGIPLHWLAWPELMSNRATAENLLEVVNAATKRERLIWEEAITELIYKSMRMAVDAGIKGNSIFGKYEVRIPLISLAHLKQIAEVWIPLWQQDLVSQATIRNMLPGINPAREKEIIETEKKEAADNSPLNTVTNNEAMRRLREAETDEE